MKYLVIAITFILTAQQALTQAVTVVDADDGKPIPDVAIYNDKRTEFCYSNASGKAILSEFDAGEVIFFQHFSYERVSYTLDSLKSAGWTVKLKPRTFEVEEFIVSANRWEQRSDEVPNHISTIAVKTVRIQNPQTAADLIALSGDVFVQKSQLGGGSPMIRGFSTNRVLIVIDGIRLNNAIYREGNIQNVLSLDPNIIDRTEIIFGPGAIIYGSDAIGGVMDFHTKRALYSASEAVYFKADALARYSSASDEQTYHLDFNLGGRKIAFMSSLSWTDYNDLKMGSWNHSEYLRNEYQSRSSGRDTVVLNNDPRIQVATGYSQLSTMNKLRFKAGRFLDVQIASHYSRLSDVPRYDRLIQKKDGILRYGDWYYGPQILLLNNATLNYTKSTLFSDEIRLIIARQDYTESRHDRKLYDDIMNEQTEKVVIWSANIDADKTFDEGKSLVYYGIEYVMNDIKSTAQRRNISTGEVSPAGSRYPNGTNIYNSFGLYGGYKNNLSEKITLNAGLRYNFVSLNSTIADNSFYNFPFTSIESSNNAVTGSAGLVFRPDKESEIAVNLSTGFRAPNLDDLGKVFESAPGILVVPNPDLKPEYVYNIDASAANNFGDHIHTEVNCFFSWLDNAMVRREYLFNGSSEVMFQDEMSSVYAMVNAGYAVVYGAQVKAELKLSPAYRIKSVLTWNDGHDDAQESLRHVPPVFGSTHIVYEKNPFKADLYAVYNGSIRYDDLAPSERDKPYIYATDENGNPWSPGWFTVNFKMIYNIANMVDISAGVENILDVRYRPYSSGIASPGRNLIISMRLLL